jgi:hypothetical protein
MDNKAEIASEVTIVQRRVADLIPYARNPRKNDEAVDRMCTSIREFGFKVPVLAHRHQRFTVERTRTALHEAGTHSFPGGSVIRQ